MCSDRDLQIPQSGSRKNTVYLLPPNHHCHYFIYLHSTRGIVLNLFFCPGVTVLPAREIGLKNKLIVPIILCGIILVGIMVVVCGIGLSMGFKTMSVIGFFGALVVLVLLRIIGWFNLPER